MHVLSSARSVRCNAFGSKDVRYNNKKIGPRCADRTVSHHTNLVDKLNKMNTRLTQSRQTFETGRIQSLTDIVNTIAELSRQEMLLVHTVFDECVNITFYTDKDVHVSSTSTSSDSTECDTSN
jgi:hypothetical protein